MEQYKFISRVKKSTQNMKLQNKLMASYMLAFIIPLLIVSFTIYYISVNSLEDASQEFASIYTSQMITTIDDFVEEYDQITKSVLVDNEIINRLGNEGNLMMDQQINNKKVIQNLLIRVTTLKPEIRSMMLVSSNNNVYQYSRTTDTVNESKLLSQSWLKQMLKSETNLVITSAHDKSYYEGNDQGAVFTVGRLLLNYEGAYIGTLLIDLDPSDLLKLNDDFLTAGNRYDIRLIVTTKDGEVVYHSDMDSGKRIGEQFVNDKYKGNIVGQQDDAIILSNESTIGNLLVSTVIPLDKLLVNIRKIKDVTLLAILICMLFIFMISILFSYRITKPIKILRRSMKLAETGQYSPIMFPLANDEIGGLVNSYNKMILKIKALIEDVYIAEIKQKQAKFLALQTQINPHMLYNTLESIRMKAIVKEQNEIAEMIKILARMFKLALGKEKSQNLVRHEVEYAENYLKLQNIRFDDRFNLEIRLSEEVLNTPIIPLVFQPIVENSITHGFWDYNTSLDIIIEGSITHHNDILIRVIDTGTALLPEKAHEINQALLAATLDKSNLKTDNDIKEESIGLRNIAERFKLQYGEKYYVSISAECGTGTIVEMLIPRP